MSYFDLWFAFLFVPVVVLIFLLVPKKAKPYILLFASYAIFFMVSNFLIIFLLLSTISIFLAGKKFKKLDGEKTKELEKEDIDKKLIKEKYKKKKKHILVLVILFNIAFLFVFKYLKFFTINLNAILKVFKLEELSIISLIAPLGISYYTLKAISYVVDTYNGKIEADDNFVRLALYVSFFPQIMEGPISTYSETAEQIYNASKVTYHNFCYGYQRILFGFFKKLIIVDRLNILVKQVFNNYMSFNGLSILIGIISYTMLLYMEFSGTMDVVLGIGDIFDIKIPENFRQPFFSKNITDFWSRWHISLGHFLKDYVFYPVSLSKPLKKLSVSLRKKLSAHYSSLIAGGIALFCVWFLNGLWHGAGWPFLFFGMYHFVLILMGNIFEPLIIKICAKLKINRESKKYYGFQIVKTSLLVFIGEMFFRADTVRDGLRMLKIMFTKMFILSKNEFYYFGLDMFDVALIFIGLIVVLVISILKENNVNVRDEVEKKHIIVRWAIYYLLILSIIVLGAYGPTYAPVDPIYADF